MSDKGKKPCVKCGAIDRGKDGKCRPCQNAKSTAYRAANREKIRAKWAVWYVENKDKARAKAIAYREKHPEKVKAMYMAWSSANPEKVKAKNAAWLKANPEANRLSQANRRARKKERGGKLSPGLAERLFKLQKGKCACCKKPLGDGYHLDHIMPLALGGEHVDSNIQLLRVACNLQKQAKHPIDFMQQRGLLL